MPYRLRLEARVRRRGGGRPHPLRRLGQARQCHGTSCRVADVNGALVGGASLKARGFPRHRRGLSSAPRSRRRPLATAGPIMYRRRLQLPDHVDGNCHHRHPPDRDRRAHRGRAHAALRRRRCSASAAAATFLSTRGTGKRADPRHRDPGASVLRHLARADAPCPLPGEPSSILDTVPAPARVPRRAAAGRPPGGPARHSDAGKRRHPRPARGSASPGAPERCGPALLPRSDDSGRPGTCGTGPGATAPIPDAGSVPTRSGDGAAKDLPALEERRIVGACKVVLTHLAAAEFSAHRITSDGLGSGPMARYIFITGGVVSSLGKGIASAALGALLQARGYRVRLRKLDPYLNVDPGTMSPYQHGEVFVTDDGAETDLDLGHYERFTGRSGEPHGQHHHRPHLPGHHRPRAARRLSRRHRAGHPARHRRHQGRSSSTAMRASISSSARSAARSAISRACRSSRRSASSATTCRATTPSTST